MSGNVWECCWDRIEYADEWNIVGDSVYRHGSVTDPYGSAVASIRRWSWWRPVQRLGVRSIVPP